MNPLHGSAQCHSYFQISIDENLTQSIPQLTYLLSEFHPARHGLAMISLPHFLLWSPKGPLLPAEHSYYTLACTTAFNLTSTARSSKLSTSFSTITSSPFLRSTLLPILFQTWEKQQETDGIRRWPEEGHRLLTMCLSRAGPRRRARTQHKGEEHRHPKTHSGHSANKLHYSQRKSVAWIFLRRLHANTCLHCWEHKFVADFWPHRHSQPSSSVSVFILNPRDGFANNWLC